MKRMVFFGLLAMLILPAVLMTGCPGPDDPFVETEKTPVPTTDNWQARLASAASREVRFQLTSGSAGVWRVYTEENATVPFTGITAMYDTASRFLTLTRAGGPPMDPGFYWVSVQATGRDESDRLRLQVLAHDTDETIKVPPSSILLVGRINMPVVGDPPLVIQTISDVNQLVWTADVRWRNEAGGTFQLFEENQIYQAQISFLGLGLYSFAEVTLAEIEQYNDFPGATMEWDPDEAYLVITFPPLQPPTDLPPRYVLRVNNGVIEFRDQDGDPVDFTPTDEVTIAQFGGHDVIHFPRGAPRDNPGDADRISLDHVTLREIFRNNGSWTMEFYSRVSSLGSNARWFNIATTGNGAADAPAFFIEGSGSNLFITAPASYGDPTTRFGVPLGPVNEWHHIIVTYSNGILRAFRNGDSSGQGTYGAFAGWNVNNIGRFEVGWGDGPDNYIYQFSFQEGAISPVLIEARKPMILATLYELNDISLAEVRFDPQGGGWAGGDNAIRVVSAPIGRPIGTLIPADPDKTDEFFVEWNTVADGSGESVTANTTITGDVTFYAIWSAMEMIRIDFLDGPASFSVPNGNPWESIYIEKGTAFEDSGETLPTPTAPTGFAFAGWRGHADNVEFDPEAVLDADIKLQSQWTLDPSVSELAFRVNDAGDAFTGTFTSASAPINNQTVTAQFLGGGAPPSSEIPTIGDINNGNRAVETNAGYISLGREAALMLNQPAWTIEIILRANVSSTSDTFTLAAVQESIVDTQRGGFYIPAHSTIFRAQKRRGLQNNNSNFNTVSPGFNVLNNAWRTVTITKTTGGSIDIYIDGVRQVNHTGGEFADLNNRYEMNPFNFLFLGRHPWNNNAPGDYRFHEFIIKPGAISPVTGTTNHPEKTAIEAKITALNTLYEVRFHPNGGNWDGDTNALVIPVLRPATTITVGRMPAVPAQDDHLFMGWWTSATPGEGTEFTGTTTVNEDGDVFARWEELGDTYTITFNANGGYFDTPGTETTEIMVNQGDNPDFPVPSHATGTNVFAGWFDGDGGTGTQKNSVADLAGINVILYARWLISPAVITLNPNGGTFVGGGTDPMVIYSVRGVENIWPLLPVNPTKNSETFVGWNTEADGKGHMIFDGMILSDNDTFYAHWSEANLVFVDFLDGPASFRVADGTPWRRYAIPSGSNFGAQEITLPEPLPVLGFEFHQWVRHHDNNSFTSTTNVPENWRVISQWNVSPDVVDLTFSVNEAGTAFVGNYRGVQGELTAELVGNASITAVNADHRAVATTGNGGYASLGREFAMMFNQPEFTMHIFVKSPTWGSGDRFSFAAVQQDVQSATGRGTVLSRSNPTMIRLERSMDSSNFANSNSASSTPAIWNDTWRVVTFVKTWDERIEPSGPTSGYHVVHTYIDGVHAAVSNSTGSNFRDAVLDRRLNPLNFMWLGRHFNNGATFAFQYHQLRIMPSIHSEIVLPQPQATGNSGDGSHHPERDALLAILEELNAP